MQKTNRLYKETLIRVGRLEMAGIDSLLEEGHTGIAEKHTVLKMIKYVRELEAQLGIELPKVQNIQTGTIRVHEGNAVYYL